MSTLKQSRHISAGWLAVRVWNSAIDLVASAGRAFAGGLAGLAKERTGVAASAGRLDAAAVARSDALFLRALREDSNLEIDWLWYAANITGVTEQRHCLKRALEINPDSDLAKRALAQPPAIHRE